ncbi:uncharacterized protein LOC126965194 [Leptidea sinapis]|uniref:uncharacterized protein LOC126965194 n=1 Tax=Leptidea sinapis TaxID=189913 RepID=UPI0021C49C0F|nr:uncharacterized protein LOC126965194 [Leptidea sinapis]
MSNRIKSFFNKEAFDFSKGYVDPFQFHKTCFILLKAFQVFDEPIPKWTYFFRYLLKSVILFCGLSALSILAMGLYHGIDELDIVYLTESGTYFLIMIYKLLILWSTRTDLPEYHKFLEILREDFLLVCCGDSTYRKNFFRKQLETWKYCLYFMIFIGSIGISMMFISILQLILWYSTDLATEQSKRPLIFPFWAFKTDFGKTPIYEISFVYANVCVSAYILNYLFMMKTQILWVREIATKADMVIWSVEDLLKGVHPATKQNERYFSALIKYRMRKIVQMHQSMLDLLRYYAKVYTKFLMFEQKVCAPVVCLSAYCITKRLEEGEFNIVLALLCAATIISVFVPSYLCSFLALKVSSICFACWNTPFWNANPIIRPYLVLIMQRSLRPLPIKTPGFEEVSLQTFSNKMASAYSFYNMLRQANI